MLMAYDNVLMTKIMTRWIRCGDNDITEVRITLIKSYFFVGIFREKHGFVWEMYY